LPQPSVMHAKMRPTRAVAGALLGAILLAVLPGTPSRPNHGRIVVQVGAVSVAGAVHEVRKAGEASIDQIAHDPGYVVAPNASA